MSEDQVVGRARPSKGMCDLAVILGLTLRFWGVGEWAMKNTHLITTIPTGQGGLLSS